MQTVDDWSKESYRVMAVASAQITQVGKLSLAHMSQQQTEARAGQLDLIGLIVLRNNLNTDSKATITQLQQRYASTALQLCNAKDLTLHA